MTRRLVYLVLAVGGLGAAGVWLLVAGARAHSLTLDATAALLLVASAAGVLLLARAVVLIEAGERS